MRFHRIAGLVQFAIVVAAGCGKKDSPSATETRPTVTALDATTPAVTPAVVASGSAASRPRKPFARDQAPSALSLSIGSDVFAWRAPLFVHEEIGGFGPHQGEKLHYAEGRPTASDWRLLYDALDKLGVWEWAASYSSSDSHQMDGTSWSFRLEVGGNTLESRGYNAQAPDLPSLRAALGRLVKE